MCQKRVRDSGRSVKLSATFHMDPSRHLKIFLPFHACASWDVFQSVFQKYKIFRRNYVDVLGVLEDKVFFLTNIYEMLFWISNFIKILLLKYYAIAVIPAPVAVIPHSSVTVIPAPKAKCSRPAIYITKNQND